MVFWARKIPKNIDTDIKSKKILQHLNYFLATLNNIDCSIIYNKDREPNFIPRIPFSVTHGCLFGVIL